MATTYGLTDQGFVRKTLEVCRSEIEADYRGAFGAGINLAPQSVLGQLLGVHAEREAKLWELGEAVHRAFDPDQATGSSQDAVAAITGTLRERAARSRVTATLTGTAGTVVQAGKRASVAGTGVRFELAAAVVIPGDGVFESVDYGPVAAPAGTLTVIDTPVAGWDGVTNALDATPGALAETHAALRVRREQELRAAGAAALDAVRADVLAVPGVTSCKVFENTGSVVDGDGLPPKSIEVLVSGGADQAIRDALWSTKPSGIETFGGVVGNVTSSQGTVHTVKFSRPDEKLVYLDVQIKKTAEYPADGDAQVMAQLVAAAFSPGEGVVSWALKKRITVAGITDVPALRVGLAAWPATEATLAIGTREVAKLDTSRIRITYV